MYVILTNQEGGKKRYIGKRGGNLRTTLHPRQAHSFKTIPKELNFPNLVWAEIDDDLGYQIVPVEHAKCIHPRCTAEKCVTDR